jgi:thiol-disulfide isomerase/thioredoxin
MRTTSTTLIAIAGMLTLVVLLCWYTGERVISSGGTTSPAIASDVTADPTTCDLPAKHPPLDVSLKDAAGRAVSLAQFKGKVVLVDFWATWCAPCKLEIPGFVELYDRSKPHGLEMVGLLLMDSVKNVPSFARMFDMRYPLLDASERQDVEDAFGPIVGLPTTFLLTPDGSVCKTHLGYTPKTQFEAEIRALLHM